MLGQLGGDVDLAVGPVDLQPARVEMELAADPAGEERLGPAIAVALGVRSRDNAFTRAWFDWSLSG